MKAGAGIWVGVAVGFALLAAAWTALFWAARRTEVRVVPLVAPAGMATEAR
jgi:hypothetical protein